VEEFIASFGPSKWPKTYALLYAPDKCYLALVDGSGKFEVRDNESRFDVEKLFEARVFNREKELRWLRGYPEAIISNEPFEGDEKYAGKLNQAYVLWGQRLGDTKDGWTKFGTARIGAFHVPVELNSDEPYARFTAIEYLKKYEDGNVAVVDERLTGIEGYRGEPKNG